MSDYAAETRVNDPRALAFFLRCPLDKGPLRLDGDTLVNDRLNKAYPIVRGVPDLRYDELPR